jgi:hypothetical protein
MKYHEGQWRPNGGSVSQSSVAVVPVSLETGPSIVRIPTSSDAASSATLASAKMPSN